MALPAAECSTLLPSSPTRESLIQTTWTTVEYVSSLARSPIGRVALQSTIVCVVLLGLSAIMGIVMTHSLECDTQSFSRAGINPTSPLHLIGPGGANPCFVGDDPDGEPCAPPSPPFVDMLDFYAFGNFRCVRAIEIIGVAVGSISSLASAGVSAIGLYVFAVHAMEGSHGTLLAIVTLIAVCDTLFALQLVIKTSGWINILNDDLEHTGMHARAKYIEVAHTSTGCALSAWSHQFLALASVSWSGASALYLALVVFCAHSGGMRPIHRQRFWIAAHAYCWGLPLITCLIAQFANGFGYRLKYGFCWLQGPFVLLFYVPLVMCELMAVLVLAYTLHVHKQVSSAAGTAVDLLIARLVVFTIFFLSSWILVQIRDLTDLTSPVSDASGAFTHEHPEAAPLLLFLNSVRSSAPPWLVAASNVWLAAVGLVDSLVWLAVFATNWLSLPARGSGRAAGESWISALLERLSGIQGRDAKRSTVFTPERASGITSSRVSGSNTGIESNPSDCSQSAHMLTH